MRRQRLRNYFGKEVDFRLLCEGDSSLLESCFAPITTYYFKSSTTGPETGSVTPSSLSDLEPGKPTNFTFRHEKGRNLSIFRPF